MRTLALPRAVLLPVLLALAACQPASPPTPPTAGPVAHGAPDPVQAVTVPTALLRANDYAGFARASVPAPLHAQLEAAWRQGRTRWPLSELPFHTRLPQVLAAFAGAGAETRLQRAFDRQFAGADRELHSAADALGVFGSEYLRTGQEFSDAERHHYSQLVQAAAHWARGAPLGDKRRAHVAIVRMAVAARDSGLAETDAFARHGMDESLRRVGPVLGAVRVTLKDYGLDLGASLAAMQVELVEQDGDSARVRMRYPLGTDSIDATVPVVRVDDRWYLADFLQHARAAAAPATPPTEAAPDDAIAPAADAAAPSA